MRTMQKPTGRASSVQGGLAFGAMAGMLVTLSGTALLAQLLNTEKLQWENVGYGIMIMIFSASYLGAELAKRKIKRQRLLVCMLSGLVYFGMLLCITALFFGGQYSGVGVTALLVLAGSGCAGLLGAGQGSAGKNRKTRNRYKKYIER